jgi:hypothetical protein
VARFENARQKELEDIRTFISERAEEFKRKSGLEIYARRMDLIAALYLGNVFDINTALEEFKGMYNRVKLEEASLLESMDVDLKFDEGAVDEIIRQAVESGQDVSSLTVQIAKKLEYGLKLVKDRAGIMSFEINAEAVTDMEKYINNLIKKYYREEYAIDEPVGREDL